MNAIFLLGIVLGMLAALMMNIGKGVQKQKVHVFRQGRGMFSGEYRRDLWIWLAGLAMTGGAMVPFSLGLKFSGSPSTISAMTGVGLIGLAVYAVRVIGEKIGPADAVGIGLVVVGTSTLGFLGAGCELQAREFTDLALAKTAGLLVLLAAGACTASLKWRRIHGVTFGLTAGMLIGVALFLADAALVRAGGSFFGQLSNPYPYAAVLLAILAVIITQIGFLRSRALEVVPAINSAVILTPLLLEGAIYGAFPEVIRLLLIVTIVAGVCLLSAGAAGRVAG